MFGELAQRFKEPSLGTFVNKCYRWKWMNFINQMKIDIHE
jgi:hypothetical protein